MSQTTLLHPTAAEYRLTLRQLQEASFDPIIASTAGSGLVAIFAAHLFPYSQHGGILGLALVMVALLVAWVRMRRYRAAAWLLVASWLAAICALMVWLPVMPMASLLVLPACLASLYIGPPAGVLTATSGTALLLLASPRFGTVSWPYLLSLWGVVLLAWLLQRSTRSLVSWSLDSYALAEQHLETARDREVELKQAIKDLGDANLQMARLNQLLAIARRVAEDAERTRAEFVANVSHELRTPLNMIIGFADMIVQAPSRSRGKLPASLLADLEVIQRNSRHLSSLIDDVLDLSQVEAGQASLARERVSMQLLVEESLVAVRPLYDKKGLELTKDVSADLPQVFCDRTRIREVLLNLLSNAGRFTEQGGVRVRAWTEGDEIVMSVSDSGPGITADAAERIFRPFEQQDSSIRRRYGGTGLGLAISKSFVELHGGRMWFESQLGRGTTFYFRLPIDPPTPASGAFERRLSAEWEFRQRTRPYAAAGAPLRPRIVVLEGGHVLSHLIERHMEGAEVLRATDAEQVLAEARRAPVQAVLINETIGEEWLRLQACDLPPEPPVIRCVVPEPAAAANILGAIDYLVRPVSQHQLLASLDRLELSGNRVLLVDDEVDAARLYMRMFDAAGRRYEVFRATDGEQGLRMLRELRPDVLLVDLLMPGMNGFQLLAAKNADPELHPIPAIIISARDPGGQPIVADSLAVTRAQGIAAPQLLTCIEGLLHVLAPGHAIAAGATGGTKAHADPEAPATTLE